MNFRMEIEDPFFEIKQEELVFGDLNKSDSKSPPPSPTKPHCAFLCYNECGAKLASKQELQEHMKLFHKKIPAIVPRLECNCCQPKQIFNTSNALTKHKKLKNTKKVIVKCVICPKKFKSEEALTRHAKEKHLENYDDLQHLESHRHEDVIIVDKKERRCPHCNKRFLRRHEVSRDIKQVHEYETLAYQCPLCRYGTYDKKFIRIHLKQNHSTDCYDSEEETDFTNKENSFKCNLCDFTSHRRGGLNSHISKIHKEKKNILKEKGEKKKRGGRRRVLDAVYNEYIDGNTCIKCKVTFAQNPSLIRHVKHMHLKGKKHHCATCKEEFTDRAYLLNHIRKVHDPEKNFQCSECKKWYKSLVSLNTHVDTVHLLMKKFQCTVCYRKFTQSTSLSRHRRTYGH